MAEKTEKKLTIQTVPPIKLWVDNAYREDRTLDIAAFIRADCGDVHYQITINREDIRGYNKRNLKYIWMRIFEQALGNLLEEVLE